MSDSATPGEPPLLPQREAGAAPAVPPVPPAPPVPPYVWGSSYDAANAEQGNPPSAGSLRPPGPAPSSQEYAAQTQPHAQTQPYAPTPPYRAPTDPYEAQTEPYAAQTQPYGPQSWGYAPPQGYEPPPQGYGPYVRPASFAPVATRGPGLGIVAFALSVVAAVGATIFGSIAAYAIGLGTGRDLIAQPTDLDFDWSILTPVRDSVLVAELAFWGGTILGIWALIQGIVAIARNRGRGWAIAAIVIAVLGPVAFAIGVQVFLAAGFASGASVGA